MNERLDRFLGWALIYEGFVLLSRVFKPSLRQPPAISQMVWFLPRRIRVVAAGLLCVKLFAHLMGKHEKPDLTVSTVSAMDTACLAG